MTNANPGPPPPFSKEDRPIPTPDAPAESFGARLKNVPHELLMLWIFFTAACSLGGWGLSAVHSLNAAGYFCWLAATAFALYMLFKDRVSFSRAAAAGLRRKTLRRFRRPFPALFFALGVMIFAGGLLYAPNNYDGLSYRIPRMLHWWMNGGWLWIDTPDARLNTRVRV